MKLPFPYLKTYFHIFLVYNNKLHDYTMPYDCIVKPGEILKIPLGYGIEIPDGYLLQLYNQSYLADTVENISSLPHPTIQKFTVITVDVVGTSRRFLSQITRHQNEVKFMSASLQYSNYSRAAAFVKPYEFLQAPEKIQNLYIKSCLSDMDSYEALCKSRISHDTAGYVTPQGLRNVLIISATPYQWKHMIGQRCCRRNTDEMRIVMFKVWHELQLKTPVLFHPSRTGPFCQRGHCQEGKMSCQHPVSKKLYSCNYSCQRLPTVI